MTGKFYGLGVGPGDPELVTLKAVRILGEVDTICVPVSSADRDSLALQVVRGIAKKEFELLELSFPMSRDRSVLEKSWAEAGDAVAREVNLGRKVAFVTIGDPMFYSTYAYVLKYLKTNHPSVQCETVPGVMAMAACASLAGIPLAEAEESLVIIPAAYGVDDLEDVLKRFDNVVLMKVNRRVDEVLSLLERTEMSGRAVYFSRCGYRDQFFTADIDTLAGQKMDYMSLMIVKKKGIGNINANPAGGIKK
ncbi:MAG: precorrin-2 C20-methyltransferase [Peptococcaceae bacterium BICA1-7]|nr:MAG: precorrin-2 C20-methyltransferase [Peptococcaceae bacterium BICA1-7]HBV96751.1 precorrin-2 C(20)-methyltransferase [Desulfotomaculum sp.]